MIYNPKDEDIPPTAIPGDAHESLVRMLHALGPYSQSTKAALRASMGVPALSEIVILGPDDAESILRHRYNTLDAMLSLTNTSVTVLGSGRLALDVERFADWNYAGQRTGKTLGTTRVLTAYTDLMRMPYAVGGNDHQRMGKRERNKVHVPQHQEQVVNSNKSKKRKKRK